MLKLHESRISGELNRRELNLSLRVYELSLLLAGLMDCWLGIPSSVYAQALTEAFLVGITERELNELVIQV